MIASFHTLTTFDRLDALSRTRALTDGESRALQQAQNALIYGRREPGLNIELARRGMLKRLRRDRNIPSPPQRGSLHSMKEGRG